MKNSFPIVIKRQNQEILFQIDEFADRNIQLNCPISGKGKSFFALWIKQGAGKFEKDGTEHNFEANTLLSFLPDGPFAMHISEEVKGISVYFHSDFYCMEDLVNTLGCNAAVFNSIYSSSVLHLSQEQIRDLAYLEEKMAEEALNSVGIARADLLKSYLKIFLINMSRARLEQMQKTGIDILTPETLLNLHKEIELNFRKIHSPSHYAKILQVAPKSLNRLVKKHYNKTLKQIIQERIIFEAKKELYQSNKLIKNIAFDLGFADAFYFSRLFKKKLRVSPESFRNEKI